MDKIISFLDKITSYAIYGVVFIIPFSKAGIEIFAVIAITGWAIKKLLSSRLKNLFPQTQLNAPLLALFIVYLTSMFFSVDISLSLEGVFLKLAEYILLFFICADIFSYTKNRNNKLNILLGVITLSTMILFLDAIFQWVSGKDFIKGYEIGRLRASFPTANDFAGYLITILPIFFCLIFVRFKKRVSKQALFIKATYAILFLVGLVMLCATFSRGAWLGYLLSMALLLVALFLYRRKKKSMLNILSMLLILIPLIAALLFYSPARERTVSMKLGFWGSTERLYRWKEALVIIEDFPLLGAGPNTYTKVSSSYNLGKRGLYPHNSYLQMAAEVGVFGLAAFIWLLLRFFSAGLRPVYSASIFSENDDSSYNANILFLGIASGLLSGLIQSAFDTNLYALQLVILFWFMLGVGTALIKDKR